MFSHIVTRSVLIAACGNDNTAVLMYGTDTVPVPNAPGTERLSISDETIVQIRIIFDRAPSTTACHAAEQGARVLRLPGP